MVIEPKVLTMIYLDTIIYPHRDHFNMSATLKSSAYKDHTTTFSFGKDFIFLKI